MESICGGDKPFLNSALLDDEHLRVKDKALEHFHGRRKMGGTEFSEKYKEQLEQVIIFNSLCWFWNYYNNSNVFVYRKSKNNLVTTAHKMRAKMFSKPSKHQQLWL